MMKYNFIAATIAVFFCFSCNKKTPSAESKVTVAEEKEVPKNEQIAPEFHKELYGLYTGDFSGSYNVDNDNGETYENSEYKKITIKINKITKDSVYGQSITNGHQRPFRGIYNESTKSFVLDEPGDDKTDGRFQLKIKGDSLMGKWAVYKKNAVKASEKSLKLLRKDFVYNPNFMLQEDKDDMDSETPVDWVNGKIKKESYTDDDGKKEVYESMAYRSASNAVYKINASKQKLTEAQVKNLRKLDLEIIKNAVFARHGYSFKKETFRQFFENTDWYVPVSDNVGGELSPLERDNVILLNRMIKYAEDHYDAFGR